MGGIVKVKSKLGEGTIFLIELVALCKIQNEISNSSISCGLSEQKFMNDIQTDNISAYNTSQCSSISD